MRSLAVLCSVLLASYAQAEISVIDGYVRATPPGALTGAAFVTLHNTGRTDLALVGASSAATQTIELHQHTNNNGVMQMRQVGRIEIQAGKTSTLEPSGYHLMLMGLAHHLKPGEQLTIKLRFSDNSEQRVALPVKTIAPQPHQRAMGTVKHAH